MKEKFLVLEIAPHGTSGLSFAVDDDRTIHFEKSEERPTRDFIRAIDRKRAAAGKLAQWAKPLASAAHRRVIVAADSTLATTIPVPLLLERDAVNVKTKITLAELENLIAQGMAKIFNGCRNEAARRLAQNELDAVLVGARTEAFDVDGKPVRSPVGFAGRKISLLLELTFTTRELFEALKPFFNGAQGEGTGGEERFFFAEAPQAHLRAIARSRPLPLNLVTAGRNGAMLAVFMKAKDEYPVLYREPLKWNFAALTDALKNAFAVSDTAADDLYCRFHQGALSAAALRAFKKELEPALDGLLKELERAKVAGPVYVEAPHPLPFSLPYKHGTVVFEEHPIHAILRDLGFALNPGNTYAAAVQGERGSAALRPLFYFLEAYFDESDSAINKKLRRRLHWLAA